MSTQELMEEASTAGTWQAQNVSKFYQLETSAVINI
jgi:hypothetical protein